VKPEQLVEVWMSGLAVLLDRRWDGSALVPAGRAAGLVLEVGHRGYLEWCGE
jgi:hypothetical protein